MKIGIIDADLISQHDHNFPNLALMKISGYYKAMGHDVSLIFYGDVNPNALFGSKFDKIFISKVFSSSVVPEEILKLPFVTIGGTGFFYDKAPRLADEIEHHFPDYHLYDKWIANEIRFKKREKKYFKYYTDYSIGFTTRGCFRKCEFCVNRNETTVYPHSPLSEFVDPERKKICLLDDNILGCGQSWESIFTQLLETKKPFQYKQGMDIRILTERKARMLSRCSYDGDYIFAFDNYADRVIIEEKIILFKKYMPKKVPKFYIFCAFDRNEKWDMKFWKNDIVEIFERLKILMEHQCLPYLMRFERWEKSPYRPLYIALSSWCNSPAIFKKQSFAQASKNNKNLSKFRRDCPEIIEKYFNLKYHES